jgi:hypothetical protein
MRPPTSARGIRSSSAWCGSTGSPRPGPPLALVACLSDPVVANFLTTAGALTFNIFAATGTTTWSLGRRVAGTNTAIASFNFTNSLVATKTYLARITRRGTRARCEFLLKDGSASDGFYLNPATMLFQANRVAVFDVTDSNLASSPFTGALYSGVRPNPATGVTVYMDMVTRYDPTAKTYYVSNAGSDSNAGVTTVAPMLTPQAAAALNVANLPGSKILFNGGETIALASLLTLSTGWDLDSYGSGRATLSRAGSCVLFRDCDSWSIGVATGNGLNLLVGNSTSLGLTYSSTDAVRRTGGVSIQNLDVSGGGIGIQFQGVAGNTGGLNGVTIGNGLGISSVVCHDQGGVGIFFTETGGGSATSRHWSNVVLDGFSCHDVDGSTGIGAGLILNSCDSVTGTNAAQCVARNFEVHTIGAASVSNSAGPGGFFPQSSDGVLFENFISRNVFGPVGVDGGGCDFDTGASNCEIRNGLFKDCDGPGVLSFSELDGNIVHGVVIENCGRAGNVAIAPIRLDSVGSFKLYNSTVDHVSATVPLIYSTSRAGALAKKEFYNNIFISRGGSPVIDFSAVTTVPSTLKMEQNAYQTTNGNFAAKLGATSYPTAAGWRTAMAAANGGAGVESAGRGFFATSSPIFGYGSAVPAPTDPAAMVATIGHYYDPQGSLVNAGLDLSTQGVTPWATDFKRGSRPTPYSIGAVSTGLGAALTAGTATGGATGITTAAATATDATNGTPAYTYQWYRSTSPGTLGSAVSGQTTRTLAATGLTAGTAYYFTLRYTDAAAGTADSNQILLTTKANLAAGTITPGSATTTTAAATATDATGGVTPYSYQWFRSTTGGSLGSAVSGQTTRTLADSGLTTGTTYYYTLRYTDSSTTPVVINSAQAAIATTGASLVAGVASPGTSTVTTAAASATDATGGTAPYTYQWYRSSSSGTLGSAISGQTTRTLADTGLTPNTDYFYTIRYTDAAGSPASANSNQVQVTTRADLAAGSATVSSFTPTTVYITAGDATGGVTPYSYQWYRSTVAGSIGAAVAGQTTLSLIDPGRTASTTYYYTLRYTDSSSTPRIKDSAQVAVTTATTASTDISSASITAIVSAIVTQFQSTPPPVVVKGLVDISTDPVTGGGTALANLKADMLATPVTKEQLAAAMWSSVGAILPSQTPAKVIADIRANLIGAWDTTTVSGYAVFRNPDGTEAFRVATPTSTTSRPGAQ